MNASWARAGGRGFVLAVLMMTAGFSGARAETPFQTLVGTGGGSGQIRLDNGKTEALKCRAFYTQKETAA
ncbi:MAG: hypothetical protein J0I75_28410, partial [Hyphomicrobium sp.]|nr:hypothetical protein [Hyphomicrobium sp.]